MGCNDGWREPVLALQKRGWENAVYIFWVQIRISGHKCDQATLLSSKQLNDVRSATGSSELNFGTKSKTRPHQLLDQYIVNVQQCSCKILDSRM